jgi:hypothetical protein
MPASVLSNILISEIEFTEVALTADLLKRTGPYSDYLQGVVATLEWIKGEDVEFDGALRPPPPPMQLHDYFEASPETIDGELVIALTDTDRPRFARGVSNTIIWARHGGISPLLVS